MTDKYVSAETWSETRRKQLLYCKVRFKFCILIQLKALKPADMSPPSAFPVFFPLPLADFRCSSDRDQDNACSLQGSSLCTPTFKRSSWVLNKHEGSSSSRATEHLFWCVRGCRLLLWGSGWHAPPTGLNQPENVDNVSCGWLRSITRRVANVVERKLLCCRRLSFEKFGFKK